MTDSTVMVFSNPKGTSFLVMYPLKGGKVRVREVEGHRNLSNFWPVQLRKLLLDATQDSDWEIGVEIEPDGDSLVVSGDLQQESLLKVIQQIAAQITPMPKPPIRRSGTSTYRHRQAWYFVDDHLITEEVFRSTLELLRQELPGGTKIQGTMSGLNGYSYVSLDNHGASLPMKVLRRWVEWRFAEVHARLTVQPV